MPIRSAVILFLICNSFSGASRADGGAYLAAVANAVKAAASKGDPRAALLEIYRSLRLADASGEFQVAALRGKKLRAPVDVGAFVDRVVSCMGQNPYLGATLAAFASKGYRFSGADEAAVLRRVLAYAVALDRLTKLIRGDYRVLDAMRAHWKQYKKRGKHLKAFNLFGKAKFLTMEFATARYLDNLRKRKISPDAGRITLPLNIMEAVLEDLRLGNKDNARTGLTLAFAKPGEKKKNPRTGAGPTTFSDDGKAIAYRVPLAKRWADLYTVWNLAFVSHYGRFPYLFAKLLTPQVLCYAPDPTGYVYNRAVALYIHLHQAAFEKLDREAAKSAGKPYTEELAWADSTLTKIFSSVNVSSAKDYDRALNAADPTLARTLRLGIGAAVKRLTKMPAKVMETLRKDVVAPFVKTATKLGTAVVTGVRKTIDKVKEGAKKATNKLKKLFGG